MTDFEITRLAFKAAFSGADLTEDKDMMRHWSPLTDDGDALRLAVKLDIVPRCINGVAFAWRDGVCDIQEPCGSDPYTATRRAIVRTAAEIGKTMT